MINAKTAIIVWSNGQDGKILFDLLKSKWYTIIWLSKEWIDVNWNISYQAKQVDILNKEDVNNLISEVKPDELYYFAAFHHSSQDTMPSDEVLFRESTNIHVNWYFNFLNAIANFSPATKVCYASSCLIYGWSDTNSTNWRYPTSVPNSLYAITKLQDECNWGIGLPIKYHIQVVNAILYNHESEYRAPNFVSMKIIQGAINISKWLQENITLGDLSAQVDWWYAADYVWAMHGLLQSDLSWDYIISSGSLHTIQDLVEIVFGYLGLDWEKYIISNQAIITRKKGLLFGDNSKIIRDTWWEPSISFKEMLLHIINCHTK
jgi:GDPmannose 4,6-dehydratase